LRTSYLTGREDETCSRLPPGSLRPKDTCY
jgi:hypothetical protein